MTLLTIVHKANSYRFRFSTWLSNTIDVLCPDTKLILTFWKEVLQMDKTLFKLFIFQCTSVILVVNSHLYVVGGAVAGHHWLPLLLYRVPNLQVVGPHSTASIVGGPIP